MRVEASHREDCEKGDYMEIKRINQDFTISKLNKLAEIDFGGEFFFIGKTDEEISLVCVTEFVPQDVIQREDGWKAFRIQGVLDFSLVGILSKISTLLADNEIGIFAISTFNTDYILTKAENYEKTIALLNENGYTIIS